MRRSHLCERIGGGAIVACSIALPVFIIEILMQPTFLETVSGMLTHLLYVS